VQALPEEASIPFSSSKSKRDSPSIPSKQKFTLPGSLFLASPFRRECSTCERPSIKRSLIAEIFAMFSSKFATASFNAAAIPTMAGIFSVPALLPLSCAPPSIKLNSGTPFLT